MNYKKIPLQRTALIWGILILAGIFGVIAPFVFGMDGPGGGFVLAFFSLVFTITAIVVTIMYANLARTAAALLRGENLLAHWHYTPEEWRDYTENEFTAEKGNKKGLFIVLVVFSVIAVVVFILNREAGSFVALILLGTVLLVGIIAYTTTRYNHRENIKFQGEAYISRNGVYLNRRLHMWRGWGSSLESVTFEGGKVPVLIFCYSTPSGSSRASYTARVPVPAGEEETARKIVGEIGG